jgi:hypothetical protein
MATKNLTLGGTTALPAFAAGLKRISNTIDFSKAANTTADGDVAQVLNIPAGCLVLAAGWEIVKAEGGAAAGTYGDGADVDGYHGTFNGNATAGTVVVSTLALAEAAPNTVSGYTAGKLYATADTIDLVTTNALDAAIVKFFAIVVPLTDAAW